MTETFKHYVDHFAAGVSAIALFASNIITIISAALAIIWYFTRLWEYYKSKKNVNK